MAVVQQVSPGAPGPGARGIAGVRAGSFHGEHLSQVRDVDEVGFKSALEAAITGRPGNVRVNRQRAQPRRMPNARSLSLQETHRHAKLSGNATEVHRNSLLALRLRLMGQQPGRFTPQLATRASDMRQYLSLQKLQAALKAREAARSEEEAEDEFMAAMAPLADNPGNAAALAQRFYEAMGRDDLQDLLSGFNDEERVALMEELRGCTVVEEYDAKEQGYRNSFDKHQFCSALKRSLGLGHYRLTEREAGDLLDDVQDQLAGMESDKDFERYASGALDLASVAENLQQQGEDGARFIESHSELVHADMSFASKCKRAAEMYIQDDGSMDLEHLRSTMEAASRAANLDMDSTRAAHTDKTHLWAAVQSAKLIARLSTAIMLAQFASDFLQRHFGNAVSPRQLLHELLDRMANPTSPASAFLDLARRMHLDGDAMPATLKQAADFFRTMPDMFSDPQLRQTLLQNVLDAMDEAARIEDERLAAHEEPVMAIPVAIAPPSHPGIPAVAQ